MLLRENRCDFASVSECTALEFLTCFKICVQTICSDRRDINRPRGLVCGVGWLVSLTMDRTVRLSLWFGPDPAAFHKCPRHPENVASTRMGSTDLLRVSCEVTSPLRVFKEPVVAVWWAIFRRNSSPPIRLSKALRILRSGFCRGAGFMSMIRALLRSSIDAIKLGNVVVFIGEVQPWMGK